MSETQDPQEEKTYPIKQSAAFAGTTFVTMGLIDLLAHLGPTGLLVGGLASYVAWKHGPELYAQVRGMLPSPAPAEEPEQDVPQLPPGRSFVDRAIGRFPEQEAAEQAQAGQAAPRGAHVSGPASECLHLGEQFAPHADLVLSNRFAILGMPNAGKSNTIAVLSEELGRFGVPLVLFDQKPEYARLCARPYFANPCAASASTITPQNACAFGERIMRERLQVVLDLPSYQDDDVAAQVMIELVTGIWLWESARANEERLPCMLILDEADYWLPQSEQHAHVDRTKKDARGRSLFIRLQNTFFNVVHRGRSLGMGMIVCSQRPANVDNRAIAVAEWKLLLKANMPHDLAVYKAFGVSPEVAMSLGRGQAYVIGPSEIKGVFQLRKRSSPDDSQTPGLTHLTRAPGQTVTTQETQRPGSETRQHSEPVQATLSLEKIIALLEAGKIDERTLVALMAKLPVVSPEPDEREEEPAAQAKPQLSLVRTEKQPSRRIAGIPAELQEAARVFQAGMTYHELGRELHCGSAEARILWQELRKYQRVLDREQPALRAASGEQAPQEQYAPPSAPAAQSRVHASPADHEEQRIQLGKGVFLSPEQFAFATKLRKTGMSTGYRDLMPMFDLSEHHAKELNRLIREALEQTPERESE